MFSLTLEASLREVTTLRQQILRIKGESSVSSMVDLPLLRAHHGWWVIASLEKRVPMVLVGTKLDLTNEREVSSAHIEELAARWKIPVYETSAKRNWDVREAFEDLVRQMRDYYPIEDPRKKKRRKCRDRSRGRSPCIIM
jgi:putative ribosome biogenesis GTPase RsgA